GGAHVADHLALAHPLPGRDALGETGHVRVRGAVLVGMPDADVIAIAAVAPGDLDPAVARGVDRRPGRRGEVDALVHAVVAEDRVAAHAEARRQAGAVDRGAQ